MSSVSIEEIPVTTSEGRASSLAEYAGQVRLIVNVASKCGLTPQYEALERIQRRYRDRGFCILAFPANDFAEQEPGTDEEIRAFCALNYDVSFPLFAKISVKGEARHPLYSALIAACPQAIEKPDSDLRSRLAKHGVAAGAPSEILWNFEKFVLDRHGAVIARFAPDVTPDDPLLTRVLEAALQ